MLSRVCAGYRVAWYNHSSPAARAHALAMARRRAGTGTRTRLGRAAQQRGVSGSGAVPRGNVRVLGMLNELEFDARAGPLSIAPRPRVPAPARHFAPPQLGREEGRGGRANSACTERCVSYNTAVNSACYRPLHSRPGARERVLQRLLPRLGRAHVRCPPLRPPPVAPPPPVARPPSSRAPPSLRTARSSGRRTSCSLLVGSDRARCWPRRPQGARARRTSSITSSPRATRSGPTPCSAVPTSHLPMRGGIEQRHAS